MFTGTYILHASLKYTTTTKTTTKIGDNIGCYRQRNCKVRRVWQWHRKWSGNIMPHTGSCSSTDNFSRRINSNHWVRHYWQYICGSSYQLTVHNVFHITTQSTTL